MESRNTNNAERFLREKKNHKRWLGIFLCLAGMAAVLTVSVLMSPGQALSHKEKVLKCEYETHKHTKKCYNSEKELVCGYADYVVHVHNDDCYDKDGELVCKLPEIKEHKHTDACYKDEKVLVCDKEESEGHEHTDKCYKKEKTLTCKEEEHSHSDACYDENGELTCGKEEHAHGDDCYKVEKVLTCDQKESKGHKHTADCYKTERVVACGELELHTHTDKCYKNVDGKKVLTCEIPVLEEHTHGADCFRVEEISDEEAKSMFTQTADDSVIDTDSAEPDADADAVQADDAQADAPEIYTTEDDAANAPASESGKTDVGTGAQNQFEKIYSDSHVVIKAVYDESANIPDNAELIAYQITEESDKAHFEERKQEALKAYRSKYGISSNDTELPMALYNIGFYVDGKEIEPSAPVTITLQFLDENGFVKGKPVTIVHFTEKGEEMISGTAVDTEQSTTFQMDSFSDIMTIASGLVESSDLGDFLTNVTIEDGNNNPIDPNGDLFLGQEYHFNFHFSEKNGERKFNSADLTYVIPENFQVDDFGERTVTKQAANGESFTYTYWVKDNVLHVNFPDYDKNEYFIDVEMDAKLSEKDNDGKVKIPMADGTDITFDVENNALPEVQKTAGTYNPATHSVDYTVDIAAENGAVRDLNFSDTLNNTEGNILKYANPLQVTYSHFDKDGKLLGKETIDVTTDGKTFTTNQLPDLEIGEKITVQYEATVDDSAMNNGTVKGVQNNTVTVEGNANNPFKVTDSANAEIESSYLDKKGSATEFGDGQKAIQWKVQIGDGSKESINTFLGRSVTDTLGDHLTFYKDGSNLDIGVYDSNGKKLGTYKIPWSSVKFSTDGKSMTYTLPDKEQLLTDSSMKWEDNVAHELPDDFYLRADYYTIYEMPGDVASYEFSNTVTSTIGDTTYQDEGTVKIGPVGANKTITNYETVLTDGYIQYEMIIPGIPAEADGQTAFYFEDKLRFEDVFGQKDIDYYVDNTPDDLHVYLTEGSNPEQELKRRSDSPEKNSYIYYDSGNIETFRLSFNQPSGYTDSYLEIYYASDMRITYQIPLDANVYSDSAGKEPVGTVRELLMQGQILNNSGRPRIQDTTVYADVDYMNPEMNPKVIKSGTLAEDGTIEYKVEFKNWYGVDPKNLILTDLSKMVLRDSYDNAYFEYMPGSLYVEVRKPIIEDDDGGVYKLRAAYKYVGDLKITEDSPEVGKDTLEAPATGFTERIQIDGEAEGDGWGSWSLTNDLHKELVSGFKYKAKDNNQNYFIFHYKLKLKDNSGIESFPASSYTEHNQVVLKNGDDLLGEDNFDVNYKTGMLEKTAVLSKDESGNFKNPVSFTIELNPNCLPLIPTDGSYRESTLTMIDKMSKNLSILDDTIIVQTAKKGENLSDYPQAICTVDKTEEGQVLRIENLPDEAHIVVTYKANVIESGENVEISNNVELDDLTEYKDEYKDQFAVKDIGSNAGSTLKEFTLYKVNADTKTSGSSLEGAKFYLYWIGKTNDAGKVYDPRGNDPNIVGERPTEPYGDTHDFGDDGTGYFIGTYTVGEDGKVKIENQYLTEGWRFVLVEAKAPNGYLLPENEAAWTPFWYEKNAEGQTIGIDIVNVSSSIDVENTPLPYELPESGGLGNTKTYALGIMLALAAIGTLAYTTQKRRKEGN